LQFVGLQRKHLQSTKQMTKIKKPTCKREKSKKLASVRDIADGKDKRSSRKYTKRKSQKQASSKKELEHKA
jgi:hypothetical protein